MCNKPTRRCRNRPDTSSERADWTIEFWAARAVRFNGANRSGFRPIIDSVSDMAASRMCARPVHARGVRVTRHFFFLQSLRLIPPTGVKSN